MDSTVYCYNELTELKQALNIDDVSNNEVTACVHPLDQLRIIGGNISCLNCKGHWKRTS